MGRHAGWLTAAASVIQDPELKPDYIYLPEEKFDLEEFLARAKEVYERKKRALFVVSEGTVSYTHLDVYKRQPVPEEIISPFAFMASAICI